MKYAALIFGDDERQPKAASVKLSSPEPGQIVRKIDGSVYRVASKFANPDGIVVKLSSLKGEPVQTPLNFRPIGSSMARLASWLRYHLAYNRDFDLYVNSYIERYNEQHKDEPLPYPTGQDGKAFRWAEWFQKVVSPKLFVPTAGTNEDQQSVKDELIHEMLFNVLGERNVLDQFVGKSKTFGGGVNRENASTMITVFLTRTFKMRIDEMQNKIDSQYPTMGTPLERQIKYQRELLNKTRSKKKKKQIEETISGIEKELEGMEYKNTPTDMSMWQPGNSDEGEGEINILEQEQFGVGETEFESAEAQRDISKFRQGFSKWLRQTVGEEAGNNFILLFDIFWRILQTDEDAEIKRSDLEEEWMDKTGLSFGSFKVHLYRLPEMVEQFITSHSAELGNKSIFIDLMNVIREERAHPERKHRMKEIKERARPAMVSSLHIAGVEEDFAQAISNTENPDVVDPDIHQPTETVSEAAKVGAEYNPYGTYDRLKKNYDDTHEVSYEGGRARVVKKKDKLTCLKCHRTSDASDSNNLQCPHCGGNMKTAEYSQEDWERDERSQYDLERVEEARKWEGEEEEDKTASRKAKRGSPRTYSKKAETVSTQHGAMSYEPGDVVNPDEFIEEGGFNPHKIRPWLIHNEYGTLAIVYAGNEQDALDEAVDADKLDSCLVNDEDFQDAEANGYAEEYAHLGNAGEPFDLTYIGLIPLPNQQYGVSEVATDEMMQGYEKEMTEDADKKFLRDMGIQGSRKIALKLLRGDELDPDMRNQVLRAFIYRWTHENKRRGDVYHCDKCDVRQNPYVNTQSAEGHQHPTIPLQHDDEWLREHAFYFTNAGKLLPNRHAQPFYLAQQKEDQQLDRQLLASVAHKFAMEKAAYNPGKGEYIFQADVYCEKCGQKLINKMWGTVNDNGDSDTFPQGPFYEQEADNPQHCSKCGVFLENPLTSDGYRHLNQMILEHEADGKGQSDIIDEWKAFYPEREEEGYVPEGVVDATLSQVEQDSDKDFLRGMNTAGKKAMLGHDFNNADGQAINDETMPDTGRMPHVNDSTELKQPRMAADMSVAKTILEQLGGNKFIAMTGAKNFVGSPNGISFRLPGAGGFTKNGINVVRIDLTPNDTYNITFSRMRGGKDSVVAKHDDVYVDSLRQIFESETGLRTSLGTMGRQGAVRDELWKCMDCGNVGALNREGRCDACNSEAVYAETIEDQQPALPAEPSGDLSTIRETKPVEVEKRMVPYREKQNAPNLPRALGSDKTAQGSGGTTVTMQNQNVTSPNTPGKGQPLAVPDAIDQVPGPHSPNAPATAPRSPGIQPRVVNVPAGTEGDDTMSIPATASAKTATYNGWFDVVHGNEFGCPHCKTGLSAENWSTEYGDAQPGTFEVTCPECDKTFDVEVGVSTTFNTRTSSQKVADNPDPEEVRCPKCQGTNVEIDAPDPETYKIWCDDCEEFTYTGGLVSGSPARDYRETPGDELSMLETLGEPEGELSEPEPDVDAMYEAHRLDEFDRDKGAASDPHEFTEEDERRVDEGVERWLEEHGWVKEDEHHGATWWMGRQMWYKKDHEESIPYQDTDDAVEKELELQERRKKAFGPARPENFDPNARMRTIEDDFIVEGDKATCRRCGESMFGGSAVSLDMHRREICPARKQGAGSNSGEDDARGVGDLYRENFYEHRTEGLSTDGMLSGMKDAAGENPAFEDLDGVWESPNRAPTDEEIRLLGTYLAENGTATSVPSGIMLAEKWRQVRWAVGGDDDRDLLKSMGIQAAAPAAPVVSPNVVQNQNINRPGMVAPGQGGSTVAILPGEEEEPGGLKRHTVEPELQNAKYHMMGTLITAEEQRLTEELEPEYEQWSDEVAQQQPEHASVCRHCGQEIAMAGGDWTHVYNGAADPSNSYCEDENAHTTGTQADI